MRVRVPFLNAARTPRFRWGAGNMLRLGADLAILAGISGLLVWMWAQFDRAFYQYVQEVQFAKEAAARVSRTAEERAIPEAHIPTSLASRAFPRLPKLWRPDPGIIGRLEVPRLGLAVIVREGIDAATLRRAVGHVGSTALPGEKGNFVVLGHRDSFFRGLRELKEGDVVRIRTTKATFSYAVQSIQVVGPESLTQIAATGESAATLITCFPFNYVGPAPRRFVAHARLMDEDNAARPELPLESR